MMSSQAVTVAPVSSAPTLASWTIKSKFQPRQHGIGARVALRLHAGGHQRAAPVAQVVLVHPLAQPRVGRAVGQRVDHGISVVDELRVAPLLRAGLAEAVSAADLVGLLLLAVVSCTEERRYGKAWVSPC